MDKPKAPKPLNVSNVTQQANAQNQSNAFSQAAFNRPNQTDAFGNTISYTQTGTDANGNPTFSVNQGLGALGQQYATGLSGLGQQYFNTVANPGDLSGTDAFNQASQFWSENAEPRFEQQRAAAENRLRNQGLDPTSEAYRTTMNDQALQQNEARNSFMTSAQNQFFNQALQGRQQRLSELSPGLEFGNMALNPSYANVPGVGVDNVDVAGLATQSNADLWKRYQTEMDSYNGMLGGLAGLGGTALRGYFGGF